MCCISWSNYTKNISRTVILNQKDMKRFERKRCKVSYYTTHTHQHAPAHRTPPGNSNPKLQLAVAPSTTTAPSIEPKTATKAATQDSNRGTKHRSNSQNSNKRQEQQPNVPTVAPRTKQQPKQTTKATKAASKTASRTATKTKAATKTTMQGSNPCSFLPLLWEVRTPIAIARERKKLVQSAHPREIRPIHLPSHSSLPSSTTQLAQNLLVALAPVTSVPNGGKWRGASGKGKTASSGRSTDKGCSTDVPRNKENISKSKWIR